MSQVNEMQNSEIKESNIKLKLFIVELLFIFSVGFSFFGI